MPPTPFPGWRKASKLPRRVLGVEAAAERFTGLKPGKRQAWTPRNNRGPWPECLVEAAAERFTECLVEAAAERFTGSKTGKRRLESPVTTEGRGLSAWSKLPRRVLGAEAAAEPFTGLRPGKRQAWTPRNNRGPWPECLVEAAAERFTECGSFRGGSCRGAFYGFEAWQMAGLNAP